MAMTDSHSVFSPVHIDMILESIHKLFLSGLTIIVVCQCCQQIGPEKVPSEITDKYIGKYQCSSITFLEGNIAIHEGFEPSADLYSQFSDTSWGEYTFNGALSATMDIHPVAEYDVTDSFSARIPMQGIRCFNIPVYTDGGLVPAGTYLTEPSGSDAWIPFSYSVKVSGDVQFFSGELENRYYEDSSGAYNIDYKHLKVIDFEADGRGAIKFTIHSTFYDYSSGQLVDGDVEYVYERVSYRL